MPRTCTPTERTRIGATGVNHFLKLEVADADGVMRDCSALGALSLDLLDGSTWNEALDTPLQTGTLSIRRDTNDDSAAPTMGTSSINRNGAGAYAPLFEKGRAARISSAVTAPGVAPITADWKEMLLGRIDSVQWQSNPMTITVSDLGAWIADAFIQAPKQYQSSSTTPGAGPLLGGVIQAMLADVNIKGGTPTLYEPVTALWQPWAGAPQQPDSLMAACRGLAQEIGWEFRYRYGFDAGAGVDVFKLSLYEPNRSNTTPDWIIGPTEYRNVTRLETSIADIRNSLRGYYNDISSVTGRQQYVTSTNAASIAKYGERFMSVSSTAIRNATDMQAFTDAVLSDLAEASADQEIELPYFWPVQIGDVIKFLANGDHYDTDQILSVVSYTHTFANGEGSTVIQARGKVAGAFRQWLSRGTVGTSVPTGTFDNAGWEDSDTTTTVYFTPPAGVDRIWAAHKLITAPQQPGDWNSVIGDTEPLPIGASSYGPLPRPADGQELLVRLEGRLTDHTRICTRNLTVTATPQVPHVNDDDVETDTAASQFLQLTERGLKVLLIESLVQVGSVVTKDWGPPSRGAGATSVVKGRVLVANEAEEDVTRDLTRPSWILFRWTLDNGAVIPSQQYNFDRSKVPTIVSATVNGTVITVLGDPNTKSIRITKVL
jgi:hypothetical protein